MEPEAGLLIGELARLAGVTPRTIRYYVSEGLLPPPTMRGTYAHYGGEHLRLLRLIARLKEAYLPLSAIHGRLATMSAAEAERLLGERPGGEQLPGERAEAEGGHGPRPWAQPGALPPGQQGAGGVLAERPASYGLPGATQGEEGRRPAAGEPAAADPLGLVPAPLPLGRVEFFPATPDEVGQGPRDAASGEELWRQFPVAPGVELRVREPLSPRRRRQIEALLAAIRDKLQSEEE
jgi:DNA-binding transcriptional MerR regulator